MSVTNPYKVYQAKPREGLHRELSVIFAAPNNFLLDQENFPAMMHVGDVHQVVFSDRDEDRNPERLRRAMMRHLGTDQLDYVTLDRNATRRLVSEVCAEGLEGRTLTGFRVVRDSRGNGVPIWRFEAFAMGPNERDRPLYTGQTGDNVITETAQ